MTSTQTVELETTLEVLEAPPLAVQGRKYPFHVGTMRYRFRVKGNSRVYWVEQWEGEGQVATREAWYEGFTLYIRSTNDPNKLLPIELGSEREGFCIKSNLVEGGILGWRLAHGFDDEQSAGWFIEALEAKGAREEKLMERPVVVLDLKIGVQTPVGTSRLWIDRETLLPLQRETNLRLNKGKETLSFRVRELYANWKINERMANESFHVEGMGPPDALVDAPENPADFEEQQTREFLGFDVRDFPKPQGPAGFDELPRDAPNFVHTIVPQELSGPEPRAWYQTRKRIVTKGPDGSEIEAYCGYRDDDEIAPDHRFESIRENRRHRYGWGGYHPQDVFIGKRVGDKLQPALFFRDVGSHNTAPHHLAVDGNGRCHLMVADVDKLQRNRFKLLWVIGDLSVGKWTEAWLIHRSDNFTSSAHPWSAAWGETVHLIWCWNGKDGDERAEGSGVFHVTWTPAGFGQKVRVYQGDVRGLDMAVDPDSGRLLLVFSTDEGVFAASRPSEGPWTRPTGLHSELTRDNAVSVEARGNGAHAIRTKSEKVSEWLLKSN